MTHMKHDRLDCGYVMTAKEFTDRCYSWGADFTEEDGSPLVMVHCPGCGSDVVTARFVIVSRRSLRPCPSTIPAPAL